MAPLDIKLEIVLDDDETTGKKIPKFFPGDDINGKIYLTSNQNYTLRHFRLAWTGRIQAQPIQTNKETRIYFDECWKLNTITKPTNKKSNVYSTELIPITFPNDNEPTLDLSKNKTVALTFKVHVPNDRPLPSCTTELPTSPNKIIYLLEAFIDEDNKPTFFAQKTVPVYESISINTPEMNQPQRKEQVFMVSLLSDEQRDFTSAMRVTLPCRGSQPGIAIPVSISIWNNMEFSRRQGISISLLRVNQVLSNGRAYTSQGEKIQRVVTDLNITSDDQNKDHKVQTVRVSIPIPRGTLPTIPFESSQLLNVSYFIRVQVFAQEGIYTTSEGKKSQFMMLDIPFIIGTHSRAEEKVTPISSPTLSHATLQSNHSSTSSVIFSQSSGGSNSNRLSTTSSTLLSNPSNQSSTSIFRKTSTSSIKTNSSEEKKKKKNVFSNLRLYSYKKKGTENTKSTEGVSPAVIMTPQLTHDQQEPEPAEAIIEQEEEIPTKHSSFSGGGVFNLFPDDDDDDEYEEVIEAGQIVRRKTIKKPVKKSAAVFKLFPDDDDDEEEEEEKKSAEMGLSQQPSPQQPSPQQPSSQQPSPQQEQQATVFNMFEDDDSDEEEVNDLEISQKQELSIDERVKPNHQRFENPNEKIESTKDFLYKPNTFDSSSSDSEPDEFDLLGMIARNDKRLR